ncbi:MAG: hypothetical protein OER22_14215 [Gammaproteobacteria bacterium]|nr:hypothetical protein [Gammaproteobacteria bacterium]MDH3408332.1 hypothetical protein [Gammaproteobacteria bacterium]MDH3553764.1 hypothetical protein [Gammaproteobacteria bacterium]
MIRNAAGIIAGLITAFALIWLIEKVGHTIYPPPPDLDFSDPDAIRPYIATLPIIALLFPMFAWFIGTFAGSLVGSLIGTAKPLLFCTVVGGIVLAATIANLIVIPHPLWFSIISVLGIVASAWLALQIAPGPKGGLFSSD